eukprot:780372-Prorocentrum_minimum.AAC.1
MYNIYKVETIGDVSGAPARCASNQRGGYGSLSQARDFGFWTEPRDISCARRPFRRSRAIIA